MALTLVTPATALPVTLDELRTQVRVTAHGEDLLLLRLLGVATSRAERELRRALISQTWRDDRAGFPCQREWSLAKPPLQSVTAVTYRISGVLTTLPPTAYLVDGPSGPNPVRGRVYLRVGESWPSTDAGPNTAGVEFVVGYGDDGTAVPEDIRHGILLLAAHLFEHREPVVAGVSVATLPMTVDYLWSPYRSQVFQ